MEGRKKKCKHLRSHSCRCSSLPSLIEIDLSFVTAVISVTDNTPHSGVYAHIFASARAYQPSRRLANPPTDIDLFVEATFFHIWATFPFPVMNMYASGWNLPQADRRELLTHTPEYHRVLRDVYQHSSVAEQTKNTGVDHHIMNPPRLCSSAP